MNIINRNLTLEFDLYSLAHDFGYDLEVDEWTDVWHSGYSSKEIRKMNLSLPEKYEDLDKIFPNVLAVALEDAERAAWASHIIDERISALKRFFKGITPSLVQYRSNQGVDVSERAGILDVEISGGTILISILNPEHLINSILDGVGYFSPELSATDEASPEEIKARFHNLKDFYELYGEVKPVPSEDSGYTPDIEDSYFEELIAMRLEELTLDEVADVVKEAKNKESLDMAAKFSSFTSKEIAKKVIEHAKIELEAVSKLLG